MAEITESIDMEINEESLTFTDPLFECGPEYIISSVKDVMEYISDIHKIISSPVVTENVHKKNIFYQQIPQQENHLDKFIFSGGLYNSDIDCERLVYTRPLGYPENVNSNLRASA